METLLLVALLAAVALWIWRISVEKREADQSSEVEARMRRFVKEAIEKRMHSSASDERRPRDWQTRREYVLKRDGYRCVKCGSERSLHVHHKCPVSKVANHSVGNLVTLCASCHSEEDGHGVRVLHSARALNAQNRGYVRRKSRKDFVCARCGTSKVKGSTSYVKKSEFVNDSWSNSNERICESCML